MGQRAFPVLWLYVTRQEASITTTQRASFSIGPVSPWRAFDLKIHNEVRVNEELVPSVALLVDILHQQVTSWFRDPTKRIGALVQNYNPVLRVQVVPEDRLIYVDHLSSEEAKELTEARLRPTPFIDEPVH